MTCIKTGGWFHAIEYGNYVRGDLFQFGSILLIRANTDSTRHQPPEGEVVFAEGLIETQWKDYDSNATFICEDFTLWYSYDGTVNEYIHVDEGIEFKPGKVAMAFVEGQVQLSKLRKALEPFAMLPNLKCPSRPDSDSVAWSVGKGEATYQLTVGDFELAKETWTPF